VAFLPEKICLITGARSLYPGFLPNYSEAARRTLLYVHDAADLGNLREPPDNRLEALQRDWKNFFGTDQ
jgi:plasmid maintenance system killer protein